MCHLESSLILWGFALSYVWTTSPCCERISDDRPLHASNNQRICRNTFNTTLMSNSKLINPDIHLNNLSSQLCWTTGKKKEDRNDIKDGEKAGSMLTKPAKVLQEGGVIPLFYSHGTLWQLWYIYLLTWTGIIFFHLCSCLTGSVRYISTRLKYCYLETCCWATALSLFDILNFMSTVAIHSMHHV